MKHIETNINFPLKLTWEDGSVQLLNSIADIQCNLEDFDSDQEPLAAVEDANGARMKLKVSMTWIEELRLKSESP